MPKITWAQVAILSLIVLLILGVVAMIASPKDVVIKASPQEISLQTTTPQVGQKP